MKDKKTIIDSIRALFNEETPETVEVKFEDVKDESGNIIRIEEGLVSAVLEDGSLEPMIDATIVLEDGSIIKTDSEGMLIAEEDAVEDVIEEEMNEDVVEKEVVDNNISLEEKINQTISRKTKELEEKLDGLLAKFNAVNEKLDELAKAPAEKEIKIKKTEFNAESKSMLHSIIKK